MSELKKILNTTPKNAFILEQNGISSLKDFFLCFPRTYEDRGDIKFLKNLDFQSKSTQIVKGKIVQKNILPRGSKKLYEIVFQDEQENTGFAVFFNTYYTFKSVEVDQTYLIIGKPEFKFGKIQFSHPEFKKSSESGGLNTKNGNGQSTIHPIYSEMMGIKPSWFAKKSLQNLDKIPLYFQEYLPEDFLKKYKLPNVVKTMKDMHYPQNLTTQKKAVRRIFFDRLLRIQIHSILNKQEYTTKLDNNLKNIDRDIIKNFLSKLPFQLTNAQKKVIKEVVEDFHSGKTMMRLLQGDVGSGKTIVAVTAIWYILQKFGGQIAFLVPLSVLAKQHFLSISKLLLPLGIHTELLSGEISLKQKNEVKKKLKNGQIQVLVGTHAIIQDNVFFQDLKFVVIDEQHKFGVSQRGFLKKNQNPHILQMSATPIPRSMALAFFGEFEVSVIDEMPLGRKEIITKIVSEKDWLKLKPRILDKIKNGQKLFVVAPLIEESEKMEDIDSASETYFELQETFKEVKEKIGLLHGRMSPKEKNEIMSKFKTGKIIILVSTTVIEVGVDIPEATMMVIKNAERFGLSQLHQLRGRIGRNDLQSYCFLETKKRSSETYKRLKAMEETNDGFKLAEIDLENRGSGEILGQRQSGESDIPFEILSDIAFLEEIQQAAKDLLKEYPNLEGMPLLQDFVFKKVSKILV